MAGEALLVEAPAKVNLYLAVGERRSDGYHDVETVMQALELHDSVLLTPADTLRVTCEPDPGLPGDENLVARAARALGEAVGRDPAYAIRVRKRIPAGGGLGGGSADAAATLAGLAHAWALDARDPALVASAASVGADVPFFLAGGCALLRGRGDRLVKRLPDPRLHVALVNPGVPVSTAAAYAALDATPRPAAPGAAGMVAALEAGDPQGIGRALFDDMTPAALGLAPVVADALALLRDRAGVLGACLSGSGSTVFGIFADALSAEEAARAGRGHGWWAEATRTRDGGVALQPAGHREESE
ncbi:MAG TPA: 4-(cytidine 5'-diphospho)-2-C-methyl-D-erythritol kinase [Coriobacteriia bacterium]